jgi:hypothetical protein
MPDPRDMDDLEDTARTEPHVPRAGLAKIPRRREVSPAIGLAIALGFAVIVAPVITAEAWLGDRVDPTATLVIAGVVFALAALASDQLRRSIRGRRLRVQLVSFAAVAVVAGLARLALRSTELSALAVPVAALAIAPAISIDRTVGLTTGVVTALIVGLVAPFDLATAIVLVVQAAAAALWIPERGSRGRAVVIAGAAAIACAAASSVALAYLTGGELPGWQDPLHQPWLAAAIGAAGAAILALVILPVYRRLVGEIAPRPLRGIAFDHPVLHQLAGQLDDTGLAMADLRRLVESLYRAMGPAEAAARPGHPAPRRSTTSSESGGGTSAPLRRGPNGHPMPSDPAHIPAALARALPRVGTSPFSGRAPTAGDVIASSPPPPPLRGPQATPTAAEPPIAIGTRPLPFDAAQPGWSRGLADRVEAQMASDDWGVETPVVAPSEGELRLLFGQPDPTRQLPPEQLELLQRRVADLGEPGQRRPPHPTAEVDPDDIEAAIELAPPARQPIHAARLRGLARQPPPRPKKVK